MEVVLLSSAESDLLEHYLWYAKIDKGLVSRLDRDVADIFEMLSTNPVIAPCFGGSFRRQLLRRWSLGIFYSLTANRVLIARVPPRSDDASTCVNAQLC